MPLDQIRIICLLDILILYGVTCCHHLMSINTLYNGLVSSFVLIIYFMRLSVTNDCLNLSMKADRILQHFTFLKMHVDYSEGIF